MITLVALAVLALAGIVATCADIRHDGYRQIRTLERF